MSVGDQHSRRVCNINHLYSLESENAMSGDLHALANFPPALAQLEYYSANASADANDITVRDVDSAVEVRQNTRRDICVMCVCRERCGAQQSCSSSFRINLVA